MREALECLAGQNCVTKLNLQGLYGGMMNYQNLVSDYSGYQTSVLLSIVSVDMIDDQFKHLMLACGDKVT